MWEFSYWQKKCVEAVGEVVIGWTEGSKEKGKKDSKDARKQGLTDRQQQGRAEAMTGGTYLRNQCLETCVVIVSLCHYIAQACVAAYRTA